MDQQQKFVVLNPLTLQLNNLSRPLLARLVVLLHDVEVVPVPAPHADHSQILTDNAATSSCQFNVHTERSYRRATE